jgi:hypothetical protein
MMDEHRCAFMTAGEATIRFVRWLQFAVRLVRRRPTLSAPGMAGELTLQIDQVPGGSDGRVPDQ